MQLHVDKKTVESSVLLWFLLIDEDEDGRIHTELLHSF